MREWMMRFGLTLIVMVGAWASPLSAQLLVVPEVPYVPAYHPRYGMAFAPPPGSPESAHLMQRMLNSHGMGCEANRYGSCGSFHSEFRFIFGSCRDFFGDRCVPNPPHSVRHGLR